MTKIDEVDRSIVRMLQDDGAMTNQVIAASLKLSEATVRRRRLRLEEQGVIRMTASANPHKLGFNAVAVIFVQALAAKVPDIENELRKLPEVHFLGVCAGTYDLMMEVWLSSQADIVKFKNERLGKIDGVIRLDVYPLLKLSKYYAWSGGIVSYDSL
ncbi:MAG: Lrp/AsnC family transcriptional regulator [Bauldia sp.]|uniref:Lrp/AsnC family transcriptional regulator n=1 Tax=Bauldia sp. TaxID=2575872 RepID=UPI001DEA3426|nr:Lrp/AsnC family transcriptional regulator [Bauldia sp.]MCB1497834.1 Lrp/AsnC family transcriptional regulator [Bauldia sp.]